MFAVHAANAAGDALFLGKADIDAIQWVEFATATEAMDYIDALRSGMRYDEEAGRFLRNRVATIRLIHPLGRARETFTR
jgi:hypothetical protein